MHPEHFNLLPPERRQWIRREYFHHLATVAFFMATMLVALHGALLVPTYQFLDKQVATRTKSLADLNDDLASSDEQALAMRLAAVQNKVVALSALATSTSQVSVLQEIFAEPRVGITISGVSVTPAHSKVPETVALTGRADTRDDLRAYYLQFSSAPFIATANLPVSAYAAESNIGFTITLTLP
jgi:hypothetical protein